ncbi:MAG: PAS domain-containing protein, partial [Gammaproteobacteria bacterium]
MSGPAEQSDHSARDAAAPAAAAVNFQRRLRETQIALVYSQAGPTLIGAVAALLFYFYVLYGAVPAGLLTGWLSASAVVYLLRYLLVVAYRRADAGRRAARPWDVWFLIGALLSGLLWGLASVMLLPEDSIAHQAFLVVGVTGVGAGAAVSYAALRGVPQAFIVPALVPFGLHLATRGDELQQMMGFVVLMFMAVLLVSALTMHESIERSLRLGLENEVLVQTLSEAKDRAEAFNRDLRAEIDERRHAEQRIRASRQELARILENMQDMYFRTDLQGRVVQVSPSVRDLLGYAPDEVAGVDIADVFADKVDLARFMRLLDEAGGKMRSFEARMRRKDGSEIWVSKNAQYYRDEIGAIAGIEGTSHDITRLKRAQADLNAEKERALVTLAAIADGVISTNAEGLIDYI